MGDKKRKVMRTTIFYEIVRQVDALQRTVGIWYDGHTELVGEIPNARQENN